jgi:hypothetical protein
MFQQIIALIIILFFIIRLLRQNKKNKISKSEFVFWLSFWVFSAFIVLGLKWVDKLVAKIGFSGSGIEVLLYFGVAILFYFIFRVRIRLEKMEKNITEIVKEIAINKK